MRILFVSKVMLDQAHGAGRHVLALCRAWIELGHEVTLLGPDGGERIEGLARICPPAWIKPGLRMEAILAALAAAELARKRYDVVYMRLSATTSFIPLVVFAARVPLVLELNGVLLDQLRDSGRSEAAIRTVQLALRPTVRRADALIAPSPNIAEHAESELGCPKATLVWNGADLEVAATGDRKDARARLDVPDGRWIGFAGSLADRQRFDLLFEAHRRIRGVGLLIAGDGPRRSEVEAWSRATPPETPVRFFGSLPHERAMDVVRASDVCVTAQEGDIGMKLFEYAAIGRRFVMFAERGHERFLELYPGEEAVFVVHEKTADALEHALRRALEVEEQRGPLAPDAVAAARAEIGWNRTAQRVAEVLESVRRS